MDFSELSSDSGLSRIHSEKKKHFLDSRPLRFQLLIVATKIKFVLQPQL